MDLLIASNVLLWLGFIAMALVNLALLRQVGVLYERVAPAGALAINKKLEVGQFAPELSLQTLTSQAITVGGQRARSESRAQLLFFVSPDCPVCKTLLPAIKSAAKAEAHWMDLILASDGDRQDHAAYVRRHGLGAYPYVVSATLGKTYGVARLPYAVLIEERGRIASLGIINSREHLDSLFEAKERKVASIQDFITKNSAKNSAKNSTKNSAKPQR